MSSSEPPFSLETVGGRVVISLLPALNKCPWGEIEKVGTRMIDELNAASRADFVVDLSQLDYMGSAVVALVVRLWKSVQQRNGRMVVVNQNPIVLEVLSLAGLTRVWTIVGSRDEAFGQLGTGSAVIAGGSSAVMSILALLSVLGCIGGLYLLLCPVSTLNTRVALGILFGTGAVGVLSGTMLILQPVRGRRLLGAGVMLAVAVCIGVAIWKFPENG